MPDLGVNALAMFTRDRPRLLSLRAGAFVIMDAPDHAQALKAAHPTAVVVHRSYSPNDPHWHDRRADGSWVFPPAQWLADHRGTAGNGVYCQVFNEPTPINLDAFLRWIEELVALCPSDLALALPAWAVGNPHHVDIERGVYDRLLRAVCGTRHALLVHEYWRDDPVAEYPYLCGRFEFWLDRAKEIGLPAPTLINGEYGRDHAGGVNDGWRGVGYSEREYADLLTRTHERVYAPHGIPCAVFCYGAGADGRWQSFDIEGAETVLEAIEEYNMSYQPGTYKLSSLPGQWLNVRAAASTSAEIVGKLVIGDTVTVAADTGDGWLRLAGDRYVSLLAGAVVFAPYTPPLPEVPTPGALYSLWLTLDEAEQFHALVQAQADLIKVAIERARRAA